MNKKFYKVIMYIRLAAVKIICVMFLPRELWVGKHFGAYTQKTQITFGRVDNRGVLQGFQEQDMYK